MACKFNARSALTPAILFWQYSNIQKAWGIFHPKAVFSSTAHFIPRDINWLSLKYILGIKKPSLKHPWIIIYHNSLICYTGPALAVYPPPFPPLEPLGFVFICLFMSKIHLFTCRESFIYLNTWLSTHIRTTVGYWYDNLYVSWFCKQTLAVDVPICF